MSAFFSCIFFNSRSKSDGVFSSDDESVDFTRYQTNIFDVNDDDELYQHIKNMRSKKYLNSLVKDELLQIAKNNQLKVVFITEEKALIY